MTTLQMRPNKVDVLNLLRYSLISLLHLEDPPGKPFHRWYDKKAIENHHHVTHI